MLGSVLNALRVLELLSENGDMGVSEIGRELDLATPTAHRLVNTLVSAGFAERDSKSRRYRLGTKILALGTQLRTRIGVRELLLPILQEIARETGETSNLGVYRDGEVVYVEKIDSNHLFRIQIDVGAHVPAYCTALGKALLAFRDPSDVDRYLDSTQFASHTSSTLTSALKLSAELARVRKRGYALDKGELISDVWCVAGPVFENSTVVAALSVSAPRSRFEKKRDQLISVVTDGAQRASAMLSSDSEARIPAHSA